MQASTSTAATMTAAIAAVESVSECVERARVGAGAFAVDLKDEAGAAGVVVVGGVVAVPVVVGCTLADADADADAGTGAGTGTGRVGVELVPRAICRGMLIARSVGPGYSSRSSIAASASRSTSAGAWAASIGRIRAGSSRASSS